MLNNFYLYVNIKNLFISKRNIYEIYFYFNQILIKKYMNQVNTLLFKVLLTSILKIDNNTKINFLKLF